jgi:hypothetical protein
MLGINEMFSRLYENLVTLEINDADDYRKTLRDKNLEWLKGTYSTKKTPFPAPFIRTIVLLLCVSKIHSIAQCRIKSKYF